MESVKVEMMAADEPPKEVTSEVKSEPKEVTSEVKSEPQDEKVDIEIKAESNGSEGKQLKEDTTETKKFDKEDDYGYTKADFFTSEIFKIEIKNIPPHYGYGNWKKLFKNKLKVPAHKIQVIQNIKKVYVTFKNEEDRQKAIEGINGMIIKKCTLEAKVARPKKDAMAQKRGHHGDDNNDVEAKAPKIENPEETLKNTLIPWWNMDYEEQLKLKEKSVVDCLTDFHKHISNVRNIDREIFVWIMERKRNGNCLLCPVLPILPSPDVVEYRNKCSFTISKNLAGEVTVGNRLGKYRDQLCAVESPAALKHVPQPMKDVCKLLQDLVAISKYSVYNRHSHEGYWQEIVLRSNRENHMLALINFCRQDLSDEAVGEVKEELKKHFDGKLHTLLFSATKVRDRQSDDIPPSLIAGEGCIYEKLFDFNFRISPKAFFQCNTGAAEVLYRTIEEMANHNRDTATRDSSDDILLDICCGTGTIAICMSKSFNKVYGVDMCAPGIEDAKLNAKLNGVTNVEFRVGKAEDTIYGILKSLPPHANVVAVVDPPRNGLHPKVIAAIRGRQQIKSLVYVSCSITQTKANVNDLTRNASKKLNGPAFKPIKCRPVDLFPHTKHVEVVTLYERITTQPSVEEVKNANTEVEKPSTEEGVEKPSNGEVEKPSTGDAVEKPSTEEGVEKPSTEEGVGKPSNGEVEKPSTGDAVEKPSTEEAVEKPSTGEGVEKPSTGEGVEKPSTEGVEDKMEVD